MSFGYPFRQFPERDVQALKKVCLEAERQDMMICEIGAWTGCSTAVLGAFAKKNKGLVYVVDWFKGSCKTKLEETAKKEDIFALFKKNMEDLGLMDNIYPLYMTSERAATIIKDQTFDLIFIDGNHIYSYIKKDIELWLPKVKKGGILCGHDCEAAPDKVPYDINDFLDIDYHKSHHPGVIKAVFEKFPKVNIEATLWWIRI